MHHQLGVDLADEFQDYTDYDDHSGAGDKELDCADCQFAEYCLDHNWQDGDGGKEYSSEKI